MVQQTILGECLKEITEIDVVQEYQKGGLSLRDVAKIFNTNHNRIKRILVRNGVAITRKNKLKEFSKDHRRKISESKMGVSTGRRGIKMKEDANRKNMASHFHFDIILEELDKYEDFEKLKFLNRIISRHRKYFSGKNSHLEFLDKFYFCPYFNLIYDNWISSGKNKWLIPSIEHILPKSKGGDWSINNLCFLTWFENRAKAEMSLDEWTIFKQQTNTSSDLFVK